MHWTKEVACETYSKEEDDKLIRRRANYTVGCMKEHETVRM